MATAEQFERALDEKPDDWELRLVYADFLDDNDDPAFAACQRWMSGNKAIPSRFKRYKKIKKKEWAWWSEDSHMTGKEIDIIPDLVWVSLEEFHYQGYAVKTYDSKIKAERALCAALIKEGIIKDGVLV